MKDLDYFDSIPLESLREQVIDRLTGYYAEARLGMEEFEERVERANQAQNQAALALLLSDLPQAAPTGYPQARPRTAPAGQNGYQLNTGAVRAKDSLVCIFSGQDRKGVWKPPRKLESLSLFSGTSIDLSKAQLPPEGMTITSLAVFSGVDIIVPRGVRVAVKGMAIFGGYGSKADEVDDETAPLITIDCLAVFGAVEVRHPKR